MAFSANGMTIITSWKIGKRRKQEDRGNKKKITKSRKREKEEVEEGEVEKKVKKDIKE